MALEVNPGIDVNGAPILLVADAPAPEQASPEQDRSQGSSARRRDAVVDAARTLEDLSPAGVEQHVRRRWRGDRPVTPEDFQSFSADARAQRAHDVVDALDFRIRRAVYGRAAGKQMHVAIPRGIVGKSLASLDREETAAVVGRLRDRGWTDQQILRHGVRRVTAKKEHIKGVLSASSGG
jgi:hypothetical protein